jgi:hypothetical protein
MTSNGDLFWEFIIGVLILAVVFMIVRPGAPVNAAITGIGNALAAIVQTATQYDATPSGIA